MITPIRHGLAGSAVLALVALGTASPAQAVKRLAFATSATGTGLLSSWPEADGMQGLQAGDAICVDLAAHADLPNASGFRAWLSNASTDAFCHVQGLSGKKLDGCSGPAQPAGPWFLVGQGSNFTGSLAELAGPEAVLFRGVILDENGTALDSPLSSLYWTGTSVSGRASAATCSNWGSASSGGNGSIGDARATAQRWTQFVDSSCDIERRLLCLEGGASEPPATNPWTPSALVFATSTLGNANLSTWLEAGGETGIAGGDAICQTLATAAHLPAPESFVAWLSDSGEDARDRITQENVRFRRVDHYQIADSKADLLDGTNDNSLHVDEWGRYLSSQITVLTGTTSDGTADGFTCDDWTAAPPAGNVTAGSAANLRSGVWTAGIGAACPNPFHLYCFSNAVTIFWDGFDLTGDAGRWSLVAP
jgi:hypothetical protein